jgi:O-antigen/teichoic acid export membrane protein
MRTGRDALTTLWTDVLSRIGTLTLSIVVARILSPFDVGTLGLSVAIVGLVSMLSFFPENAAVIVRRAGSDHEHALAGCLTRGGVTAIATVIVGFGLDAIAITLGGDATGADKLYDITALLLWQPWLESVASYPRVILRRKLDLGYVARMHFIGNVIFVGAAVALLSHNVGNVSVVWAQLVGSAAIAGLAWWRVIRAGFVEPWRWPSPDMWSNVRAESVRLFIGGFGGYVSERVDNLLVARSLGPASAGFYSVAWSLARTPVNVFAQIVSSVVIPVISVSRKAGDRVTEVLRNSLRLSYLFFAFGGSILLFLGPILAEGILGSRWQPLGPVLRVMAFSILNAPVQFLASAYLMTIGKAHMVGVATSAHLVAEFVLIPPMASRWGVVGAGYADLVGTTLVTVVLVVSVWFAAGPLRWIDLRVIVVATLAALLATASAAAIVPAAQVSVFPAVVAAVISFILFIAFVAGLGGADIVKELVVAAFRNRSE